MRTAPRAPAWSPAASGTRARERSSVRCCWTSAATGRASAAIVIGAFRTLAAMTDIHTEPVLQTRTEKDPLGELEVPFHAYYGVQTQRAIRNFPISGRLPDPALVAAAVQVKKAAARANRETGRLPADIGDAIVHGADEILGLRSDSSSETAQQLRSTLINNFRVDPFQAGAGVSHNMNTNEVLANRAIEILGARGIGSGNR